MATKKTSRKKTVAKAKPLKDPNGGLTAAGRKAFREKEGSNLKPGVKGEADTPEKMRRKGSFLRRHFANLRGPLADEKGKPTRLALSAQAWGERVPKTEADAKKLADKGTKLLEGYKRAKSDDARPSKEANGDARKRAKKTSVGKQPRAGRTKPTSNK